MTTASCKTDASAGSRRNADVRKEFECGTTVCSRWPQLSLSAETVASRRLGGSIGAAAQKVGQLQRIMQWVQTMPSAACHALLLIQGTGWLGFLVHMYHEADDDHVVPVHALRL